jgi:hypothetical protein
MANASARSQAHLQAQRDGAGQNTPKRASLAVA